MNHPYNRRKMIYAAILFGGSGALPVSAGSCLNTDRYEPVLGYRHHTLPNQAYGAGGLYRTPRSAYYSQHPYGYRHSTYPIPYPASPPGRNTAPSIESRSMTRYSQSSPVEIELPPSGDIKLTLQESTQFLTDATGQSLYTYTGDSMNQSSCSGQCALNWPPVLATSETAAAGDFAVTQRSDGSLQWTYKGQPLYKWVGDSKAGDTSGDGVGGVWNLAEI